jgi:23S rRNA (cytosine1962-C5)-methyltransferase
MGAATNRSLDERVRAAVARRARSGLRMDPWAPTNAFRLIHGEADALPAVAVDYYAGWLVLHLYDEQLEHDMVAALQVVEPRGVYVKRRPRQANVLSQQAVQRYAPSAPVWGEPTPEPFSVLEHGLTYQVQLGHGLSTGLFLDQRDNRLRVRQLAAAKRVLNLFSYTAAFSIAAGAGGATECTNVDASKATQARAERNVALSGVSGRHSFVTMDVFEFLKRAQRRGEQFDVVILDPPSYSTTKKHRFSLERDAVALITLALGVLRRDGTLLSCTNLHNLSTDKFVSAHREATRQLSLPQPSLQTPPPQSDFHPAHARDPHLKTVLVSWSPSTSGA